jgi:hypothetical protein
MDRSGPLPQAPRALAQIEAALLERQALLLGPDTPAARDRIDALGLRVAALLEQIEAAHPPRGDRALRALEDEAAPPGAFDRFLGRGGAERRAG